MRRYETVHVIDSTLEPERIESIISRVNEIVTKGGGTIIDEKRWGKRRLTYEINKRQYGYYTILNYNAPTSVVQELEKFFRINQYVLRYLTIHIDSKELKLIEQDEERRKIEEEKALEAAQANSKSEG